VDPRDDGLQRARSAPVPPSARRGPHAALPVSQRHGAAFAGRDAGADGAGRVVAHADADRGSMKAGGIVVTGASGIVGRAVLAALRGHGNGVVPVVHGRTADPDAIALDLAESDLTDHVQAPDAVVHLAAAVPHAAVHGD